MRASLQQRAINAIAWQVCLGGALPWDQRAGGGWAWEPLILGGADVHERGHVEAKLNGWRDGQVVGAVWDVAEHQDDHERPEHRAHPSPTPAIRIEQTEEHATRRDGSWTDGAWIVAAAHHFTVNVPAMFGCTVQMNA